MHETVQKLAKRFVLQDVLTNLPGLQMMLQ